VPGAHLRRRGELAFGTVDSWLLWKLTGGHVHATDVSNASRTMLFDIRHTTWDDELLALLHPATACCRRCTRPAHVYGETDAALFGAPIPIGRHRGRPAGALFGQACFKAGMAKNTYGTGCFMLMHTGDHFQTAPTACSPPRGAAHGTPEFALEGSVFIGGAVVQWLRDGLQGHRRQRRGAGPGQQRARRGRRDVRAGLHRPGRALLEARRTRRHRGPDARQHGGPHRARGAGEHRLPERGAAAGDGRDATRHAPGDELRVDGGACVNDLLMQFQADLLGIPVVRPQVVETTALGAAYLAGLAGGAALHAGDTRS
jgi:glycerol kinase